MVFREVIATLPYADTTTSSTSTTSCNGGKLITPSDKDTLLTQVILPDRKKTMCYVLGRALLTGKDIATAAPARDPVTGEWVVDVHFANNDFVGKVAASWSARTWQSSSITSFSPLP